MLRDNTWFLAAAVVQGAVGSATAQTLQDASRLDLRLGSPEVLLGMWQDAVPDEPETLEGDSDLALAQKSQNPIGNLISVPFENTTDFGVGPEDGVVNVLAIKPVYPTALSDDWNLINRFILPVIYQDERFPGEGSEFGLGDFTYQAFFVPRGGEVMWGVGPALTVPTNTDDRLGRDQWLLGPAFVVLYKPDRWLVGTLISNVWDIAGASDEPSVSLFSLQYFVNYNMEDGWYLTSTPTMIADWNADSGDRWTIPVGGGVGKLVRIGDVPIDLRVQGFWYAEAPDNGPEWAIQFQLKLLFPK
ncbi:MAG: transporter family protein [Planctomycetota bacterium]|jgi:hypothetical protein